MFTGREKNSNFHQKTSNSAKKMGSRAQKAFTKNARQSESTPTGGPNQKIGFTVPPISDERKIVLGERKVGSG